ncbi:MAG: RpiB/LacA/LacB family sugar-phosphate isomerase [Magnetococcus sp. WYHC-3]
MKIFIGADHAGFELKEKLVEFLKSLGHDATDFGAHDFKPDDDYPDYIIPVARAVGSDPLSRGIILGGSGQGEAICANRFNGVRAIVYYGGNEEIIKLSREHNDANILSLGARFLSFEEAKDEVLKWLNTNFSGEERHMRRIGKIENSK